MDFLKYKKVKSYNLLLSKFKLYLNNGSYKYIVSIKSRSEYASAEQNHR